MSVPGENSDLAGRVVHVDAEHGKAARGHLSVAELHAHLASLPSALKLEVSQAAVQHEHGVGRRSRTLEHLQRQRTIWRKPRHAAVFKLNLGLPAVGCGQLHAFHQRRIGHRLLRQHLSALRKSHLAIHIAQSHRARWLTRA